MSSLAHESNPKEDSIIISAGDVLSTAQLDLDFLFFGSVDSPNVPSAQDGALTHESSTCADVFEWNGETLGQDFIHLIQTPASGNSLENYNDQTLSLRINSTEHCYGVLFQSFSPLNFNSSSATAGNDIAWWVTFNGVVDGTPRAGPCIWISDDSKANNATLWAAVINGDANALWLCKWVGQSLGAITVPVATLLMPNAGDIIRLYMVQEAASVGLGSNGIFLSLYDSASNLRDSASSLFDDTNNSAGSQVRHSKMNIGFISIGGVTAGKLEFKTRIGPYVGTGFATPILESTNPS